MEKQDLPENETRGTDDEQDSSLPVPTDYRRNVWILIVMVSVIVLAWIISVVTP